MIEPRTLKGFRDYLPELMLPREWMLEQARKVYRSYGFAPIDTPALEYTEILLGKGSSETDKQLYRFTDHGGRDVALRFDLTVPFARFAAEHIGTLGKPFKRYHMGPVWRGENTQRGRYREFWQCDFDTIGTTSNAADIETALVIHDLMAALGLERFEIRVNHRMLLNGVLEQFGMADKSAAILRVLDKLPKIGRDGAQAELTGAAGISAEQASKVLDLAATTGANRALLQQVHEQFGSHGSVANGVACLQQLLDVAAKAGIDEQRLRIDLSICRGLDYYTGTIYETFLTDLPTIGSVCSGGRYDDLASLYTKEKLPGVGASLGLDRLLAALEELNLLKKVSTPAQVLMVQFSADHLGDYQQMARALRAAGIGVEVFPEAKKLGAQFQYAEKRGFRLALIAGPDEFAKSQWKIKDLAKRAESVVTSSEVLNTIRSML